MAFVVGSVAGSSFVGEAVASTSAACPKEGRLGVSMAMAQNRRRFNFESAAAANMRSYAAAIAQSKNKTAAVTGSSYYSTDVAAPVPAYAVSANALNAGLSAYGAQLYAAQQAVQAKAVVQTAPVQVQQQQTVSAPAYSPLTTYARPVPVQGGMSSAAMAWASKQTGRVIVPARAEQAPAVVPEFKAPEAVAAPIPAAKGCGTGAQVAAKVAVVAAASVAAAATEQPAPVAVSRARSTRSPLEAIVLGLVRGLSRGLFGKDERQTQQA
ncbi:hypothetical protein FVE85_2854 [Porphyridium purpureum]|uniref:Uncharacterized protein n=1 Tax=Porphyridium purpureum TaxID=35688 RepID=A0A5J4YV27_PORPP|nr:hypothetical protein FVE85_2854 [Porphyridium purpureum]|eukprot:POR6087..scf227_4